MNSASPEARRAPFAVAASCAVMLAGAGFLAFVMSQTPPGSAAPTGNEVRIALAPVKASPPAPQRETANAIATQVKATEPEATEVEDPPPALGDDQVGDADDDGLTPSLSPHRVKAQRAAARRAQTQPGDAAAGDEPTDFELAPRLKPSISDMDAAARQAAIQTPPVLSLGQSFLASEEDGPPPFYFASDIVRRTATTPPLAVAYAGDVAPTPRVTRVTLVKGETFVDAMRRAGVSAADRNAAAYAFGKHQNLRALRPGQEFVLTMGDANQTLFQIAAQDHEPESYLLALDFKVDAENRIFVTRSPDGEFDAQKAAIAVTSRFVSISGRINGSLYLSAKNAGAPDGVIAALADVFAYDIDFQRDILGGDEFEAIFEVRYDDKGALVGAGDILYGRLTWRGRRKEKGYYRFSAAENGGRSDYFDRAGQSARRLLMKTPIDGARLSSGFGRRKHPILGYARAHKGVDFAASRGTPIKAAGSGVIERADRYGGFGNYVRIRHANGYKTAYAHLNGFARGVRAGKRVNQGDIIGYVGTTGASTGPHLHYEVHLNGAAVNPQNLKIATGIALKGGDLAAFKAERNLIDAMRLPSPDAPDILAQESDQSASL